MDLSYIIPTEVAATYTYYLDLLYPDASNEDRDKWVTMIGFNVFYGCTYKKEDQDVIDEVIKKIKEDLENGTLVKAEFVHSET